MSVRSARNLLIAIVLGIAGCGFLAGCSSGDDVMASPGTSSESNDEQPTGPETTAFDGTWRSECMVFSTFGLPQTEQADGYTQRTLMIDSTAGTFSDVALVYADEGCSIEDPDSTAPRSSGQIQFDGTTTTSSGLEASVVRYVSNGGSPDLVGLLYKENNVLFREMRESTLIEGTVPTELALSSPWQFVE